MFIICYVYDCILKDKDKSYVMHRYVRVIRDPIEMRRHYVLLLLYRNNICKLR